jgi:hypothetical protein
MSVFSAMPDAFPLNVSLKSRPVAFTLKADLSDRIATVALSLFWTVLGVSVLYAWADPLAPWHGNDVAIRLVALGALVLFLLLGVGGWLWPAANDVMRRVDVEIGETAIAVRVKRLMGTQVWTKDLADYDGLLIENWGTRSVRNEKIPVAAIVLKHRDDRWTVPLVIDGALRVKAPAARRKAEQLGLRLIEDGVAAPDGRPLERDLIVVNKFQALKVRVLYALLSIGGLAAAAWFIPRGAGSADTGQVVLGLLALLLAVAMHVFAGRYVTSMRSEAEAISVESAALMAPTRKIPRSAVRGIAYREGRGASGTALAVHAPWVKVRVEGDRLPLIVDMQSEYVNEAELLGLAVREK